MQRPLKDSRIRFPLPKEQVLRSSAAHTPFYNKMVRVARSLEGPANLDSLMPMSDSTYMYNPDDFLVYLQLLVRQLGGDLPARFLPPDLSGVMLPAGFSLDEGRRLVTGRARALGPPRTKRRWKRPARRRGRTGTRSRTLFGARDMIRTEGRGPSTGECRLCSTCPRRCSRSSDRGTRVLGGEVARFCSHGPFDRVMGPARDLMRESADTGRPLLELLEASVGEVRGSALSGRPHRVRAHREVCDTWDPERRPRPAR